MNRTRSETREAGSIADGGAEGEHRAKNSNVKGMNKMKFVYRCFIVSAVIAAGLLLSALIR